MFTATKRKLNAGRVLQLYFYNKGHSMTFFNVVNYWQHNSAFQQFFIQLLRDAPFPAYFLELPPLSQDNLHSPFHCVLVDSPLLAGVKSDTTSFSRHFNKHASVDFDNLGKDARLIAPCPIAKPEYYAHLAVFSRHAPMVQQQSLWQRVATIVLESISAAPLWLSTSGLGITWLHIRLDTSPKYYSYKPYRTFPCTIMTKHKGAKHD